MHGHRNTNSFGISSAAEPRLGRTGTRCAGAGAAAASPLSPGVDKASWSQFQQQSCGFIRHLPGNTTGLVRYPRPILVPLA